MHMIGALTITLGLALLAPAQVKTEVPPVEPNAKPVTVERVKIHGASLEGNLEGELRAAVLRQEPVLRQEL